MTEVGAPAASDPAPDMAPPEATLPAGLRQAWPLFLAANQRKRRSTIWLVLGVALFALSAWGGLGVAGVAILVGVVMFHELGHLAAMWLFGYRDLAVFFVPFLGAVAMGRNRNARAWQRGLMLLAGPVPGILLGWAIAIFAFQAVSESSHVRSAVGMLLVVNGFNLLPVLPLDGGRVLSLALFSRHPTLETVFSIATGTVLAFVALATQSWLLVAVGVWTVLVAAMQRRMLVAAHKLRPALAGAPSEPERLADLQRVQLYTTAETIVAHIEQHRHAPLTADRRPKVVASYMHVLFDRAVIPTAGPGTALMLLLAYAASLALLWPLVRQL